MTKGYFRTATCLCGSVSINVNQDNHKVEACHCGMCRKWGGGPFLSVECGSDIAIDGNENVTIYESSEWAERGFCNKCGTHLFYKLKPTSGYVLPAGLIDDQDGFVFEEQIFIDRKPSYYEFANPTHNMTEAEVFEKHASATE